MLAQDQLLKALVYWCILKDVLTEYFEEGGKDFKMCTKMLEHFCNLLSS